MSKKTPEEAHPLAPLLVECFTLANAFEALAKDARQDAEEAQAEMERLQAEIGFQRHGHEEHDNLSHEPRVPTPPGWHEQEDRLDAAQNVIALCEGLVDSLRQNPLAVRDALDDLIRSNKAVAVEVEPPNRKKNRRSRS